MWIEASLVLTVIAAVVTIIERLWSPIRRTWRWATRHRRLNAALRGLACGKQLQTFTDALGQAPTHRWEEDDGSMSLYMLDDVYVQAATDRHQNVIRFAITTRSGQFTPGLSMAGIEVALGRTTYGELPEGLANGVSTWLGARRSSYAEAYYFGNPGFYQSWVVASNDAGAPGAGPLSEVIEALSDRGDGATFGSFLARSECRDPLGDMPHCWYTRPPIARFRASTAFNTLSVSGPHLPPDPNAGPDLDHVRVFDQPFSSAGHRIARWVWLAVYSALLAALVAIVLITR